MSNFDFKTFVDVLLPVPLQWAFTYAVPAEMADLVQVGARVEVEFGRGKHYAGIVERVHDGAKNSNLVTLKPIIEVLDKTPIVTKNQLAFWDWMAQYYLCTKGEIMAAALPADLKLDSDTVIVLGPNWEDYVSSNPKELDVILALKNRKELSIKDIKSLLKQKTVLGILKRLMEHGVVAVYEALKERYKPLMVEYVRFAEPYRSDPNTLDGAFAKIKKNAERQAETLMALITETRTKESISMKSLCEIASATPEVVRTLGKKGIVEIHKREASRLNYTDNENLAAGLVLNEEQQRAVNQIETASQQVVLLHGVTGSGKTEVYIELIRKCLAEGKQVLYMLPEIALTSQMISRLSKHFEGQVFVYHSRISQTQRVEIWRHLLAKTGIILGARSSLFLPFSNLGLIIVDEEHDASFKQQDPAPRYNGRDAAIFMAYLHKVKIVLGSATPSLETWFNAQNQKYGLVTLSQRFTQTLMPKTSLIDLKLATKNKTMTMYLSHQVKEYLEQNLEAKEQTLVFQNRRAYSPFIICHECACVLMCPKCDVSLNYHKHNHNLKCHYCNYTVPIPPVCEACGSFDLRSQGFGTEKVEEDFRSFYPKANIARLDLETSRGKQSLDRLIVAMEEGEIDILIGTQMVTKGLDFGRLNSVVVLNADGLLFFPDFRANERAFQLLSQVIGRAGRRQTQGNALIQTYSPEHPILRDVLNNNYANMAKRELHERQLFSYPPYIRLIRIELRHKDKELCEQTAQFYAEYLRQHLPENIMGPTEASVFRVNDLYRYQILLKLPLSAQSLTHAKKTITHYYNELQKVKKYNSVRILFDVDPS